MTERSVLMMLPDDNGDDPHFGEKVDAAVGGVMWMLDETPWLSHLVGFDEAKAVTASFLDDTMVAASLAGVVKTTFDDSFMVTNFVFFRNNGGELGWSPARLLVAATPLDVPGAKPEVVDMVFTSDRAMSSALCGVYSAERDRNLAPVEVNYVKMALTKRARKGIKRLEKMVKKDDDASGEQADDK